MPRLPFPCGRRRSDVVALLRSYQLWEAEKSRGGRRTRRGVQEEQGTAEGFAKEVGARSVKRTTRCESAAAGAARTAIGGLTAEWSEKDVLSIVLQYELVAGPREFTAADVGSPAVCRRPPAAWQGRRGLKGRPQRREPVVSGVPGALDRPHGWCQEELLLSRAEGLRVCSCLRGQATAMLRWQQAERKDAAVRNSIQVREPPRAPRTPSSPPPTVCPHPFRPHAAHRCTSWAVHLVARPSRLNVCSRSVLPTSLPFPFRTIQP